jgi:predicted nuclease of predicted toxin-antitoxin system
MLFLADESCDFAVVRALRSAGHEIVAVAEVSPRADDDAVLELARKEQRILLTEDKDFGQLVYADERATGGVILIRYPSASRASLPAAIVKLIADRGDDLLGRFVVARPGRIRLGHKPTT